MRNLFPNLALKYLFLPALLLCSCSNIENQRNPSLTKKSPLNLEVSSMKLQSNAFDTNGFIPVQYTCDGVDISPPLNWDEVPSQAISLALIVDDPDAPRGTFVHWVIYDVPTNVKQLPQQIPSGKTLPNGGVHGKNDFGKLGYGGPCPPHGIHRYFFKLYALDQQLGLAPGSSKKQLLAAMEGHVLATAELVGKYQRN